MSVVTALRIVQAGYEATPGTAVAATRILDLEAGNANLITEQEPIIVARAGSLAPAHQAYPGPYTSRVEFSDMPVSYSDLPWWLNLVGTPVASGTGAGADKTWLHVPSETADNARRATLEVGARDAWPSEFRLAGCAAQSLSISIGREGLWRLSATLVGTLLAKQARTAALAVRTVQHVPAPGTAVWLDSTSAFGTTAVAGRLLSAEVTIETGMIARRALDGNTVGPDPLAPTATVIAGRRSLSASIVAIFSSIVEFDAWRAATAQRLRLRRTGPVLGGSNWRATLDLAGIWRTFAIGDSDGLVTAELELAGVLDASIAAEWRAEVVNDLATLP